MVNGQHLDLFIYKGSLELEIYSAVFTHSYNLPLIHLFTHIFNHREQLGFNVLLKDTSTCGEDVDNSKFGAQAAIFLISQYPEIRSCFRRSDPSILIFPKKYVKVENINWWSFDVCYNFAAGKKKKTPTLDQSVCQSGYFQLCSLRSEVCRMS